jgi:hypothetical protein
MFWVRTQQMLPEDQQEVLVRYQNVVSLATYDQPSGTFHLKYGDDVNQSEAGLRWTVLIDNSDSTRVDNKGYFRNDTSV